MLGLAQIGGAGEERHSAIGTEVETLEKAKAECVIAGEPIHALLLEQQNTIQFARFHDIEEAVAAGEEFIVVKMCAHDFFLGDSERAVIAKPFHRRGRVRISRP